MESDDEDFVVGAPVKKGKKNTGEATKGKGKKKTSDEAEPKRKTPVKKSAKGKEETKKDQGKAKKGKAKKKDDSDEEFEAESNNMLGDDDDFENYNPNELSNNEMEEEEPESSRSRTKSSSEKKTTKGKKGGSGGLDSDQTTILEYMKKQNRPYSVINIFDNLHGKIKKPACQKALDALTDDGQLQAKEFGKAKVYLLNQQIIPQVSAQELDKLKEKEKKARIEHGKLADEVKEMNAYLKNLTTQMTNEQITEENERLTKLLSELETKLELYESGNYPMISDEEMSAAETNRKKFEQEYKKRKKMCMEMINSIADSMEQKNSIVIEMVGIDID